MSPRFGDAYMGSFAEGQMQFPKEVQEAPVVVHTWRPRISDGDTGLHPKSIRCHLVLTTSTTNLLFVDRGTILTEVVLRRREGTVQLR